MDSPSQANSGVANGFLGPQGTWGDYNNINFIVMQAMAKMQTATLVQIVSCTNDGGLSPFGFVDILPLVNQIDGQGNPTPHEVIHNVPYMRIQGGTNAIIIDPVAGDIGMAAFASRDISKVKNTQAQADPGSFRQYAFADCMYLGGALNATPTQVIQFNASGIAVTSPIGVTINSPANVVNGPTLINGAATINGTLNVTGVTTGAGVNLSTHVHSGVQTGTGDTGPPL